MFILIKNIQLEAIRIANVGLDVRTVILVIFSNIENKIQPESGNLGHPQNEM